MAKEFSKPFYHSRQWQDTRKAFISYRTAIDGGVCQICHSNIGKIVHHKTELTPDNIDNPAIALSFNNLQYVCHDCHMMLHDVHISKGKRQHKRFVINADGTISNK